MCLVFFVFDKEFNLAYMYTVGYLKYWESHYIRKVAPFFLQGFLDKNRDLMRPDILSVLKNSDSRFVRDLLGEWCALNYNSLSIIPASSGIFHSSLTT